MTKEQGKEFVDMAGFAAEKFEKDNWLELGHSLGCADIVTGHSRLLQSMRFGDDDYRGNVMEVLSLILKRDPDNFEGIGKYLLDKFGYHGGKTTEFISTAHTERPQKAVVFSPKVFSIPSHPVDERLVAVMFPFALANTFTAIQNACKSIGLQCKKGDDIWRDSTFIQDIFELIYTSQVVVADFTGRNPNVLYEVGIAHTLGKVVVPITQNLDDIPSDLKHHRALRYYPNTQGLEELTEALTERLRTLTAR